MKAAMYAIIKKDFRGVANNRRLFSALLIVPLVLTVIFPSIFVITIYFVPDDPAVTKLMSLLPEAVQMESMELTLSSMILNYILPVFFLMIPITTASIMAASAFVGEKERHTLETLLYCPLTLKQIFQAKVWASFLLSMLVSVISFVAMFLVIETQLARIGHRLARLYQIMQENRRRVDEERQELQTLVSDISHQVKTPVSNLKMATDTLLEKPMTKAERTDFIRGIRSQTDKLDFLFQALVKTSRLETGVIQLDKKPGRLFDTVAQAMSGIVYAAEKKEIVVSVDCPENLTVFHDSKWTSEALFNLLDNAVKYTPAGGKIAVSVVLWEMYVEIKVADTGKGISESNQAAIFRRFYREEEVHEQQGVGIGLYLAREIVTRQGGYIKVVSEPGKGSEFSIMLPTK